MNLALLVTLAVAVSSAATPVESTSTGIRGCIETYNKRNNIETETYCVKAVGTVACWEWPAKQRCQKICEYCEEQFSEHCKVFFNGDVIGGTEERLKRRARNEVECAKFVKEYHPTATGATWKKDSYSWTGNCWAEFGNRIDYSSKHLTCLFEFDITAVTCCQMVGIFGIRDGKHWGSAEHFKTVQNKWKEKNCNLDDGVKGDTCNYDLGDWKDLCTSCDVNSRPSEKYIGKMTLNDCKYSCMKEETCTAIDYGKGTRRKECYLNYGKKRSHKKHDKFDAYILEGSNKACPSGFPKLETHHNNYQHGDVCRNEKHHGFDIGWACPLDCVPTENIAAPYCKKTNSNHAACRVY